MYRLNREELMFFLAFLQRRISGLEQNQQEPD